MVAEYSVFCNYVDYLTKIIEKNRRKYTGISSKNNECDRCRRKFKVSDLNYFLRSKFKRLIVF